MMNGGGGDDDGFDDQENIVHIRILYRWKMEVYRRLNRRRRVPTSVDNARARARYMVTAVQCVVRE